MAPINWPKDFIYSPVSIPVNILPEFLDFCLSTGNPDDLKIISPVIEKQTVHPALRIKKITPTLKYKGPKPHPLVGERGVFALQKIEGGTALGEYTGEISYGLKIERRRKWFVAADKNINIS